MTQSVFSKRAFADLVGWDATDATPALAAFRRSAPALLAGTTATGTLGIDADALRPAANAARALAADPPPAAARAFFAEHFAPARVVPLAGASSGFLTGYYEPELPARLRSEPGFRAPLYRRPPDLVAVDDVSRPPGLDKGFGFARRQSDGLLGEYPDRAAIQAGLLANRGLELAWLADPVDAFFVQVQGSARLRLPDGGTLRVGYAGKTGHPYTAIGRTLVADNSLSLDEADMDGIRRWLARNPGRVSEVLNRNRSFVFFRAVDVSPHLGPVGAAGVPLTPMGSIAMDDALHTFGTPVFVDAPSLDLGEGAPFRRLVVAQDTGAAIRGPARGDLFVGSGAAAGSLAGAIRHSATFFALLPRAVWERLP